MKARIDYDLDHLRNWTLRLDLSIIAKTAWIVLLAVGRSRSPSDGN